MKRIALHAGTHKTATTAFQRFVLPNVSEELSDARIFVPDIVGNSFVRALDSGNYNYIDSLFAEAFQVFGDDHVFLLSAEKLEKMFVRESFFSALLDCALKHGYSTDFTVYLTLRNQFIYFEKLFRELNQHYYSRCWTSYHEMAYDIISYGAFYSFNGSNDDAFLFDYDHYIPKFCRLHANVNLELYSFDAFVSSFPGRPLLDDLNVSTDKMSQIRDIPRVHESTLSMMQSIERNLIVRSLYSFNYLNKLSDLFKGTHFSPTDLEKHFLPDFLASSNCADVPDLVQLNSSVRRILDLELGCARQHFDSFRGIIEGLICNRFSPNKLLTRLESTGYLSIPSRC